MDGFHTLLEFLLHTESVVYVVMGLSLPLVLLFWFFLTGRDEDILK